LEARLFIKGNYENVGAEMLGLLYQKKKASRVSSQSLYYQVERGGEMSNFLEDFERLIRSFAQASL
jgi:hypothetical protein